MLAEASTKDISQATEPKTFDENKTVAQQGGNVARVARRELEERTGEKGGHSAQRQEPAKATDR